MAKGKKKARKQGKKKELYTLTQVSQATGISMPTLQRYKKGYQKRIPSVGEGRTQRYPQEALAVFEQIKTENLARRGRPKKVASGTSGKPAAQKSQARKAAPKKAAAVKKKAVKTAGKSSPKKAAPSASADAPLLSLAQIQRLTGISYPTLMRYVKINLPAIPHVGDGRKRRYMPDAVEVFTEMRAQSARGGRKVAKAGRRAASATRGAVDAAVDKATRVSADLGKRIQQLEATQARISKQLEALFEEVRKPFEITINRR